MFSTNVAKQLASFLLLILPGFTAVTEVYMYNYVTRLLAVRLVAQNSVDSYIYMYSVFILPCSHAIKNISN